MNIEVINVGALPNDGTGDPLRTAYIKINNNFASLNSTSTNTTESYTFGTDANQIIWETPVDEFAQGSFQIRSGDPSTQDSQNIIITAQILNDMTDVKWSGYGTTFNGIPLTNYDMDVFGGNVRLLASPIANTVIQHFIASTVTYIAVDEASLNIQLDGYPDDNVASTEGGNPIVTE